MRRVLSFHQSQILAFLSIQAQDFIEDEKHTAVQTVVDQFLSIQAQDFIEDTHSSFHVDGDTDS